MIEEKLMEYLPDPNTVKGGLAEVVDIIQVQAPLVVDDIIRWHIAYNLTAQIISLIVFITIIYAFKKGLWKVGTKNADDSEGFSVFICIVAPLILFTASAFSFFYHLGWIKPLVAPRLFLLEYFANFVK